MAVREREPGKRVRMSRPERRDQFLDVTARLVREHGIESITMDGVSAAVGTSKGLIYAYFADRDTLLDALGERELDRVRMPRLGGGPEDRLGAIARARFEAVAQPGSCLNVLLTSTVRGQLGERIARYRAELESTLARLLAREAGVTGRQSGRQAGLAATALVGALDSLARRAEAGAPTGALERIFVVTGLQSIKGLSGDLSV